MSESTKPIFLSYASQAAAAARRICDALRTAGHEVWFDQSELRGGDAWDAAIRKQVKECALFIPLISSIPMYAVKAIFDANGISPCSGCWIWPRTSRF
jgi:hypothetical protein